MGGADDLWWKQAKVYELYVDKFAKDFKGLTEKLDHFTFLGINTIHILPHYPSPMVDDGYDVSDYENVRKELGTMDDFRAFTAAAHARGIKVLVDFVLNHVSTEHTWFKEARVSKESPRRDFFYWSDTGTEGKELPNPFVDFKPSNWVHNPETGDYYFATFYPEQADLNWNNPAVQEAMFAHADFWVDAGVDAFRLDAIPYIAKDVPPINLSLDELHALVKDLRSHLDTKYGKRIALLAEVGQTINQGRTYFNDGSECQLVYNFMLAEHMLYSLLRGDRSTLEEVITASSGIPDDCRWGVFLRNHDDIFLPSLSDEDRKALFDYIDPEHKYPFNKGRSCSVRLATALHGDEDKIVDAFEMLYSVPGVPFFYYGDEIGMQNLPLEEGVVDTRKYVRGPFDWNMVESMKEDPHSLLNRTAACIRGSLR